MIAELLMEVDFVKISPTQNMTILVTSPVDRELYGEITEKIMAYDHVHAEQVGFIEKPMDPNAAARLQMAGGEFCGNASISLCAYLLWNAKLECGGSSAPDKYSIPIECSGLNELLYCDITKKDNYFLGKINMPVPKTVENFDIKIAGKNYSLPVVYMPGISHIIAETEKLDIDKNLFAETLIENNSSFTDVEAFGVMFYEKPDTITPFVYTSQVGSKVWERGCGSGSAALGAYLAITAGKSITVDVKQPGGVITVGVDITNERISGIRVESKIKIVAYGKAII